MKIKIQKNISLKKFTTFKIGGLAEFYTVVKSEKEILEALDFAKINNLQIFILGGGSNILISDNGFSGLVIHNKIFGFKIQKNISENFVTLQVGAGEKWDDVVKRAVENNLSGLECLSGIPGTAGAAAVQNIGAYGHSFSEIVYQIKVLEIKTKKIIYLNKPECHFDYRQSIFNTSASGNYIILEIFLKLKIINFKVKARKLNSNLKLKSDVLSVKYYDLQTYFLNNPPKSLSEIRRAVLKIRADKGMVILPGFKSYKSAGSFFKNPIVSVDNFEKIEKSLEHKINNLENLSKPWHWLTSNGQMKISAAFLMEQVGFQKGFKLGSAGISPSHALAFINLQDGTAKDIRRLATRIQKKVFQKFGIILETEVQLIGFKKRNFKK